MYDKYASDQSNFENFWQEVVLNNIPQAKIRYKNESRLMRFLSFFVSFYSNGFMSHVTTVLGYTVYFPNKAFVEGNYAGCMKILAHEFVHMCDRKESNGLFELRYLFPQVLSVFSLLTFLMFINFWFIFFILFLVFLIPGIPATYRTQYELAGYAMNLFYSYRGIPPSELLTQEASEIAGLFTGSWYFWMARDRQLVASMLIDRYERFPDTHPAFLEVKRWLKI